MNIADILCKLLQLFKFPLKINSLYGPIIWQNRRENVDEKFCFKLEQGSVCRQINQIIDMDFRRN